MRTGTLKRIGVWVLVLSAFLLTGCGTSYIVQADGEFALELQGYDGVEYIKAQSGENEYFLDVSDSSFNIVYDVPFGQNEFIAIEPCLNDRQMCVEYAKMPKRWRTGDLHLMESKNPNPDK